MIRAVARDGAAVARPRVVVPKQNHRPASSAAANATASPQDQNTWINLNKDTSLNTKIRANLDPSKYPPPSSYANYTTSIPPTHAQLNYANRFFLASHPSFLTGAAKFRTLPVSSVPEVAFLGRSNVGKSSLLNALVQRTGVRIARISSKPGRTKEMNAFGIGGARWVGGRTLGDGTKMHDTWEGRGGLVVLDMPGYGKASREDWGKEIIKYLSGRKQLRRTFVLIDGEHGVKSTDLGLLEVLRHHGIAHQVVLSKIDKVLVPRGKVSAEVLNRNVGKLERVFEETVRKVVPEQRWGPRALEDIITCSAEVDVPANSGVKLGVDSLRWAVLSAAGLECDLDGNKKKLDYEQQQEDELDH